MIFLLLGAEPMQAQYFGRNKPIYKDLDFKVLESPHFRLYHYFQDQEDASRVIQDSERWYKLHYQVLKSSFLEPNPLIIYKNHADFQATTAITGEIGIGTGGVTEGMKNRVVMPVTLSNKQTDHVLGHEMVHAFQYNLLRTGDSTSISSVRNLPLWMVEGLAEYMSIGSTDPNTAMWMRDAVLNKDIPTLRDLTRKPEYFPYRWGQAFWSFVAGTWGDGVIRPLFMATAIYGYEEAIELVLRTDAKTLGSMWRKQLEDYYAPYMAKAQKSMTGTKLLHRENAGEMNISPMLSPNGKYIAYLSEQDVISLELFLADAKTGKKIKRLSKRIQQGDIDNINFLESAGTWSPFGEHFAFSVYSKGRNQLAILDVAKAKIIDEFDIPGVEAFSYPAWSPDGNSIVVSGLVEGQSDLYLYNLRTRKTTQLTNDAFSDLMPSWSGDGSRLVFSSDRPIQSQVVGSGKLSNNLTELVISTGEIKVHNVFSGADNLNPVFEPNGNSVLFLSDRDGFRNMYRYNLDNESVAQLTDYVTGISGITSFSPAISIARNEATVAYSYYLKGDYIIYTAPLNAFTATPVDAREVDFKAAVLPPQERIRPIVDANLATVYTPATTGRAETPVKELTYKPQFKLDNISNIAGVGVSSGPFGTGIQGGVNMLFSDIVGKNQLFAAASLNGEIYDFGAQVAYLRQVGRLQWGAIAGNVPYQSATFGYAIDTIQIGEDKFIVDNLIMQQIRTYQRQFALIGNYILSTTRRFEFGGGISHYSFRIDQYNNYYFGNAYIRTDKERLDAPDGFAFEQVYGAYVGDNSLFGLTSPLDGRRYRLHAERYFGEFNIWTFIADYRQYFFVRPFALAFRVLHQGRYGEDAESNQLAPLTIAYPTYIRGFGNEYISRSQEIGNGITFNNLYGSRVAVANAEIRLPFTGPERLAALKSDILFTDLNLFVDGGIAWSSERSVEEDQFSGSINYKPLISTGLSLRVNLFGYMVIEPYYAIPIEKNGRELANFGVNFAPGW
ncbi:PD40 domain-containing protein [Pontibacter sp. KCTC 32443]|uniref:PD40 domain-containing protein n=1 Tax=Pontibacter TaxID=323449 RepID=UPI00164DA366|nr:MULTISPECIES: PD40 domain-containing protein [Pontibacter]MBC5775325.1 PD40 domain-containing protein [Pontibacter sp. KCTC 32443]